MTPRSWVLSMLISGALVGVLIELLTFRYVLERGWTVQGACPVGFAASAAVVWGFWSLALARRRDLVRPAVLELGSFPFSAGLAYFFKAGVLAGSTELLGSSLTAASIVASISGWGLVVAGAFCLGEGATTASQRQGSQEG